MKRASLILKILGGINIFLGMILLSISEEFKNHYLVDSVLMLKTEFFILIIGIISIIIGIHFILISLSINKASLEGKE